jgi:hypothetical protein
MKNFLKHFNAQPVTEGILKHKFRTDILFENYSGKGTVEKFVTYENRNSKITTVLCSNIHKYIWNSVDGKFVITFIIS